MIRKTLGQGSHITVLPRIWLSQQNITTRWCWTRCGKFPFVRQIDKLYSEWWRNSIGQRLFPPTRWFQDSPPLPLLKTIYLWYRRSMGFWKSTEAGTTRPISDYDSAIRNLIGEHITRLSLSRHWHLGVSLLRPCSRRYPGEEMVRVRSGTDNKYDWISFRDVVYSERYPGLKFHAPLPRQRKIETLGVHTSLGPIVRHSLCLPLGVIHSSPCLPPSTMWPSIVGKIRSGFGEYLKKYAPHTHLPIWRRKAKDVFQIN